MASDQVVGSSNLSGLVPFYDVAKSTDDSGPLTNDTRSVPIEFVVLVRLLHHPLAVLSDSDPFRLQAFQNAGVEDPIEYAERPDYVDSA